MTQPISMASAVLLSTLKDMLGAAFSTGSQLVEYCRSQHYKEVKPIIIKSKRSFIKEGGQDPLDYIFVYQNQGSQEANIPKHWHYVGLGLSDIHGYAWLNQDCELIRSSVPADVPSLPNIYAKSLENVNLSGFGIELTFRLKCESDQEWNQGQAPEWPKSIMQDLAKYVFSTKSIPQVGDHFELHQPLDSSRTEMSRIKHLLLMLDPQLKEYKTVQGSRVRFIQLIGCCQEELEAAREANTETVIDMMRLTENSGGPMLITDMNRNKTIFELDPRNKLTLQEAINKDGSVLAEYRHSMHKFSCTKTDWFLDAPQPEQTHVEDQTDDRESRLNHDGSTRSLSSSSVSEDNEDKGHNEKLLKSDSLESETGRTTSYRNLSECYILLDYHTARVLPTVLRGRLAHKRSFEFRNFRNNSSITFVPQGSSTGSLGGLQNSYVLFQDKNKLQIVVPDELRQQMIDTIGDDYSPEKTLEHLNLPKNYAWPKFNLYLTVIPQIVDRH